MSALVEVQDLVKHFPVGRKLGQVLRGEHPTVKAVDGVSFAIGRGENIGILGESGCGKTTLGRLLLRLITPTAGEIRFDGRPLSQEKGEDLLSFRRRAQLVFQNPFDALNPRFTMATSLAEPLRNTRVPAAEHRERIRTAMQRVHLPDVETYADKYPHQLSGGQLQRVVLARALVVEPEFIVADEPVSMLDVSVRAGILNVMKEIGEQMGLAAAYISHDLALVRYVCERTLTMYCGVVVEDGPTEEVVHRPQHPYTQALVKAVPVPHVDQPRDPLPIKGGVPDARNPLSGCRFRDRCPYAFQRCAEEVPPLREIAGGHRAACHLLH
ncbi:MAG TPA: ABC transporter ATP-binding protein [Geminicoccaceae bacterium]|nr:ABC transporter ATP-binding protein [Geminicoccaceae bacterium]